MAWYWYLIICLAYGGLSLLFWCLMVVSGRGEK